MSASSSSGSEKAPSGAAWTDHAVSDPGLAATSGTTLSPCPALVPGVPLPVAGDVVIQLKSLSRSFACFIDVLLF